MTVVTERRGRTLIISMQREEKRNAIDAAMTLALDAAFNELEDDPELWVGVLTGTRSVFCAGTDLRSGAGPATPRGGEYGLIRRERRKPLIAAIEGAALGGGLELGLACDLIVASSEASLGLPEVSRGVVPTCGGLFRGPRTLPVNIAKQLILTGVALNADRAYTIGLVNELCEPGQAVARATEIAQTIAQNAPVAVQASLAAVNRVLASNEDVAWPATEEARSTIAASDDLREGVAAFAERRRPVWTGR